MKKLLAILGPAIIAASAASVVNINPYQNNEELSNKIINAEREGVQTFETIIDTSKYNDGTGKSLTQTYDETDTLTTFVNTLRDFVRKNNIVSLKVTEFQSKFHETAFSGKFEGHELTRKELINDFAFGTKIESLSQQATVEKVDHYGNYSWELSVSAIIDGKTYSNVNFNTYEIKQYFNAVK